MPYAEPGYGYPESGETVINVTNGKVIRLLVDDEPFDIRYGELHEHERLLDFRPGVLRRYTEWSSPAGRTVRVSSLRIVSFTQRAVAAICYEVQPLNGWRELWCTTPPGTGGGGQGKRMSAWFTPLHPLGHRISLAYRIAAELAGPTASGVAVCAVDPEGTAAVAVTCTSDPAPPRADAPAGAATAKAAATIAPAATNTRARRARACARCRRFSVSGVFGWVVGWLSMACPFGRSAEKPRLGGGKVSNRNGPDC